MQLPKEMIVYKQKSEQSLNLSHEINLSGCLLLIELLDNCLSQNKIFSAQGLILIYSKHINIWALSSIINKLAPLIYMSHFFEMPSKAQYVQTTAARPCSYIPGPWNLPHIILIIRIFVAA